MRQDTMKTTRIFYAGLICSLLLAGCQSEESQPRTSLTGGDASPELINDSDRSALGPLATRAPTSLDRTCDEAAPYSQTWLQCEATAYSMLRLGTEETLRNQALLRESFRQGGLQTFNYLSLLSQDPTRLISTLSPSTLATLVASGDPFRHPTSPGPDGIHFYEKEAIVKHVFFHDRDCGRLDGRIWIPRDAGNRRLPAVVINNGSIGGTQPMYFWAAQALVRAGYMVMTFDIRSQGLSDAITPSLKVGANLEPSVYWLNLVDAIDFLHSSPDSPQPQHGLCKGDTNTNAFNPLHANIDRSRLGVAGHSFGAAGASFAQGFGAPDADAWPGLLSASNPIDAIVAWDALSHSSSPINANGGPLTRDLGNAAGPSYNLSNTAYPKVIPRVPALDIPTDFGAVATPHLAGEEKSRYLTAFNEWVNAGLDAMVVVPYASTHTQLSQNPFSPASSWCGDAEAMRCNTGWVIPMATHYTVAWFDRWLKQPGEPGFDDADKRLLDNGNPLTGATNMSWHYTSARHVTARNGRVYGCDNLRRDC